MPLEAQKGRRGTGVPIRNLVSGWKWVFKATPLPALPPVGWVGIRSDTDVYGTRKISYIQRGSNSQASSLHYSDT